MLRAVLLRNDRDICDRIGSRDFPSLCVGYPHAQNESSRALDRSAAPKQVDPMPFADSSTGQPARDVRATAHRSVRQRRECRVPDASRCPESGARTVECGTSDLRADNAPIAAERGEGRGPETLCSARHTVTERVKGRGADALCGASDPGAEIVEAGATDVVRRTGGSVAPGVQRGVPDSGADAVEGGLGL